MRKLLSPQLLLALLPLGSTAQTAAPAGLPFTLQGHIPASPARKAYLSYQVGATYRADSATVTNGRFQFKGVVARPQKAWLVLPAPGSSSRAAKHEELTTLYLEKGTITLTSPGRVDQAVATGTPLNQENAALSAQTAPLLARQQALWQAWEQRPAAEQADTALEHRVDAEYAQLNRQVKDLYLGYLRQKPANAFSLYVLETYEGSVPHAASYAQLFQALAPAVRTSPHGREVARRIEELQRTALGALAPDFSLPDPTGKLLRLSDLRGQYVLVDFWASWCKPCRAENPVVARSYATYKDRRFTVLSVSLDSKTGRAAWLKAIHDDGLTWPQVSDLRGFDTEVARQYSINAIPQNFLLDPQGRIIAKNLRGEALPQKLAQLLPAVN